MNPHPVAGDHLLFYGCILTVTETFKRNGKTLVKAEQADVIRDREMAREELRVLQSIAPISSSPDFTRAVSRLSRRTHAVAVKVQLNCAFLSWWNDRQVWVSEGRILSGKQSKYWQQITGNSTLPLNQRAALELIETHRGS